VPLPALVYFRSQGNKGGVVFAAWFYGESLCFLNTHLSAHLTDANERVDDFMEIIDGVDFDDTATILSHELVEFSDFDRLGNLVALCPPGCHLFEFSPASLQLKLLFFAWQDELFWSVVSSRVGFSCEGKH